MTQEQDLQQVLNTILEILPEDQLKDIAQYLLDPECKKKQQILCNPKRFIPESSVLNDIQVSERLKMEERMREIQADAKNRYEAEQSVSIHE